MPPSHPPALAEPRSPGHLFVAFTLIALQGFGGVMAVMQRELVEKRRWLKPQQFLEDWAVAQILPGPNVVNMALMVGDRHFGLRGAAAAASGLLALPLLLVLAMALLFASVARHPQAQGALRGMGAVAAGVLLAAGLRLIGALAHSPMGRLPCALLALATFGAVAVLRWPLWLVLLTVGSLATAWAWHCLGRTPASGSPRP